MKRSETRKMLRYMRGCGHIDRFYLGAANSGASVAELAATMEHAFVNNAQGMFEYWNVDWVVLATDYFRRASA